jgi:type VI protein secretion system component Hcp
MFRFNLAAPLLLLGCAAALLPAFHAMAATSATMTIDTSEGNAAAKVKGNKLPKGATPPTVIQLLSVTRPASDVASGSAAGRRSPSAADTLIVTKYYDANSAQLEQAASTNQVLPEVTIAFQTAIAATGATSNSKAKGNSAKSSASGMGTSTSQSNKAQALILKNVQVDEIDQTRNLQKITLEYQSIEVTYASGKTASVTATDDWETP